MKISSHMANLEERTVRTAVTFDKKPAFSRLIKPLKRPGSSTEAFDAVKARLNDVLWLMNAGEITPGELEKLARVFAQLRQYVREADRVGMADEFGESTKRLTKPGLYDEDSKRDPYPWKQAEAKYKRLSDDELDFALKDAWEAAQAKATSYSEMWYYDDMAAIRKEAKRRGTKLGDLEGMTNSRARRLRRSQG